MIIVSWSPVHGQTAITSNLLAVAIYSTLRYQMKSIITQTNFCMNHLEAPLIGNVTAASDYFQDTGIDCLARSVKSAPLDRDAFYNASVSLLNKNLTLLSGTKKCNQEFFESDMEKVINNIIGTAEQFYDVVYIDTNSGRSGLTLQVIDKADLVLINLCQNKHVLNDFFNDYDFNQNKTFYLIGNYDHRSVNNIRNLRKQYKKLNANNSAVIPYCTEFADAASDGTLIDFMKRNMEAKKEDRNSYFMNNVALASEKIRNKLGERVELYDICH